MLLNCAGGDSSECLGLWGDPTSPILKEITSEYSLEGLMLKLKLQYFGHLMQRANSSEKTLMMGKTEGRRRREQQRTRRLDGITDSMAWVWASSGRWWRTGKPGGCSPWGRRESDKTEWLNNSKVPNLTVTIQTFNERWQIFGTFITTLTLKPLANNANKSWIWPRIPFISTRSVARINLPEIPIK